MKRRSTITLITIVAAAMLFVVLYFAFSTSRLSRIKASITKQYGNQIISVKANPLKRVVEVALNLKSPNLISIKKEIEKAYPGVIHFRLANHTTVNETIMEDEYKKRRQEMFENYLFDGCELIGTCDFEEYRKNADIDSHTLEKEVWETIEQRVDSQPNVIPIEKEIVEENDLVKISYRIYSNDMVPQVYNECPQETVRCGQVLFDSQIEKSIEGRRIGETYTIDYVLQHISPQGYINCKCEIKILFAYTTTPAELNDAFAKENTMFSTVQEWHDALLNDMYTWRRQQTWDEICSELINNSTFTMNETILTEKAAELAFSTKMLSEEFGISEIDLLNEQFGTTDTDQFIRRCYHRCEHEIKEYLLISAIADYADISISENELKTAASQNATEWESLNKKEQTLLEYNLLYNKVINYMCRAEIQAAG